MGRCEGSRAPGSRVIDAALPRSAAALSPAGSAGSCPARCRPCGGRRNRCPGTPGSPAWDARRCLDPGRAGASRGPHIQCSGNPLHPDTTCRGVAAAREGANGLVPHSPDLPRLEPRQGILEYGPGDCSAALWKPDMTRWRASVPSSLRRWSRSSAATGSPRPQWRGPSESPARPSGAPLTWVPDFQPSLPD